MMKMAKATNKFSKRVTRIGILLGATLMILSVGVMYGGGMSEQRLSNSEPIKMSRESCVDVIAMEGPQGSKGTGFFIDPTHVITCCHVISKECSWDPNGFSAKDRSVDPNKLNLKWQAFPEIAVVTQDGKPIPAECISQPTPTDPFPAIDDFAILELKKKPTQSHLSIPLCQDTTNLVVGDDVYFSGFPFGAPVMLTHKGMLSGMANDHSVLCVQAPINKGNSGGALLNSRGEVVGIISVRVGGISDQLKRVRKTINALKGQNVMSLTLNGEKVDFLTVDRDTINILDTYISTGIGYAKNISYARDYIARRGLTNSGGEKK
jgi:V8-like Glu-specific endopeptidase